MYLRIGGRLRPFNEADASISYFPVFDGLRRMVKVRTVWQIDGSIVLQQNATQSNMTQALAILENDFRQPRPDLVFLEDDGSTPSRLSLLAQNCLDGPRLTNFSYPKNADKVYAISVPYTATMEADSIVGSAGNAIMEFNEEIVDNGDGGWERVHVGGAINPPEEQIGVQHNVYTYRQTGSAVGLYDYPQVPPAIWPALLKRPYPATVLSAPQIRGAVDQMFRINWSYTFESSYRLFGRPHRITN